MWLDAANLCCREVHCSKLSTHLYASIYRNFAFDACFKAPESCYLTLFARLEPSKVIPPTSDSRLALQSHSYWWQRSLSRCEQPNFNTNLIGYHLIIIIYHRFFLLYMWRVNQWPFDQFNFLAFFLHRNCLLRLNVVPKMHKKAR